MSIKNILVPLDGSKLAEAVIPMASLMAGLTGARLILFHVVEENPPGVVHGEHHLTGEGEATQYLEKIIQTLSPGLSVEQHVHSDAQKDVAQSIVAHSKELGVDLIVMCSHGQSGFQKRIFGTIPQAVLATGDAPVLLISPEKEEPGSECDCKCILVPLDGDPDHEAGLDMAVELSGSCQARLHLVIVVHEVSTLPGERAASAVLMPSAASALLDMACEDAELYLAELMGKLLDQEINVTGQVDRGDPAKQILQAAADIKADLIVLGTHGKTAMDAFWSGSLTPKITTQTNIPLLLVPVHKD